MKQKLMLFFVMIAFILNFFIINSYANIVTEIKSFDFSVGRRSSARTGTIKPSQNTAFALVEVNSYSGRAEYDAAYQTLYGANWIDIGRIDNNYSKEDLQFHPENGQYNWGTKKTICSGSNTTDYYCMLNGYSYRVEFENDNLFYSFSIKGRFYGYH